MRFEATQLEGLLLVIPDRKEDARGHFVRTFCADTFARQNLVAHFSQSSLSFNTKRGTVRGMHYQNPPHAETKLVRCARGAIHDVIVDLREGSSTYRQWQGFALTADNGLSLYIPPGFAHGFQTLQDQTEVAYAITPSHVDGAGQGVRWDDPALAIRWPEPVTVISERDRQWPLLGRGQA